VCQLVRITRLPCLVLCCMVSVLYRLMASQFAGEAAQCTSQLGSEATSVISSSDVHSLFLSPFLTPPGRTCWSKSGKPPVALLP